MSAMKEVHAIVEEQERAVEELMILLAGEVLAGDIAPTLNCGEVEVIARALTTHGQEASASTWLEQHAIADDCEEHENIREQAESGA